MYDEETPAFVPQADILDAAGNPILHKSFSDTMINAEELLTHGDMNGLAIVVNQSMDDNGKTIVSWNENPMLNTLVYECEFFDGTVNEYAANIITENIFLEADVYGHRDRMMTGITDHKI